jgi:hypothetical protein
MNEEHAKNRLDNMRADHARAVRALEQAEDELSMAQAEEKRTYALYQRQALWMKADELRQELSQVLNEASGITIDMSRSEF